MHTWRLQVHAETKSFCPRTLGNGLEGQQWTQGSQSGSHSLHKELEKVAIDVGRYEHILEIFRSVYQQDLVIRYGGIGIEEDVFSINIG